MSLIPNFKSYLKEEAPEFLEEKLIQLNKGERYGQVVFLAGGAGSGKGFAATQFMEKNKFKVRDVDEFKLAYLKMQELKGSYPELAGLDLRNPKDVFKLHMFVKEKGSVDKTLELIMGGATNPDRLPNIMFDITGKSRKDFEEYFPYLQAVGYDPKNIHLVWVLTNYAVAVKNNAGRARVVPDDILLKTHEGAASTVITFLKGELPRYINGEVHVVFNNRENTIFWAKPAMANKKMSRSELKKLSGASFSQLKSGEMIPMTNSKGDPVIKSFKSIQVKKAGKPIESDKEFKQDLFNLIRADIPKTVKAWADLQEDYKAALDKRKFLLDKL